MKGILKIYHPDETLKYNIKTTYCKAVYINNEHFLEVEIITDDSLDHVEDDSLQYNFPQLSFSIFDFPIPSPELEGNTFKVKDSEEETYTEVDLYDDEDAILSENELSFHKKDGEDLQLLWHGKIDDFLTNTEDPLAFKLKCTFKEDEILVDED